MLGPGDNEYYDNSERQSFFLNIKKEVNRALSKQEKVDVVNYDLFGNTIAVYLAANGGTNIQEVFEKFSSAEDFDSLDKAVKSMVGELNGAQKEVSNKVPAIRYKNGSGYNFVLKTVIEAQGKKQQRIDVNTPALNYVSEKGDINNLVMMIYPNREFAEHAKEQRRAEVDSSEMKIGAMKHPREPTNFLPRGGVARYKLAGNVYIHKDLVSE